jgi:hypothetical protein
MLSLAGFLCVLNPSAALSRAMPGAVGQALPEAAITDEMACFAPEERLLFNGVPMSIQEAEATGQQTITMVRQSSIQHQPSFEEIPIDSFYHHHYNGGLITIETWDGHVLHVTMTHPMIRDTGEYILAQDVQPEMRLLSVDGPTTVSQTRQSPYEGEVWHIVPATDSDALQLVVSQGLLSGALPLQKALVAERDNAHG